MGGRRAICGIAQVKASGLCPGDQALDHEKIADLRSRNVNPPDAVPGAFAGGLSRHRPRRAVDC